jgi:hypothetical protein
MSIFSKYGFSPSRGISIDDLEHLISKKMGELYVIARFVYGKRAVISNFVKQIDADTFLHITYEEEWKMRLWLAGTGATAIAVL